MLLQQLVRAAATAMQHTGISQHLLPQHCVPAALQHHSVLGATTPAAAAAAAAVVTRRTASSKGRGSGRKAPSHVRGYDRLLSQWQHMTARPGSTNSPKGSKAKRPHAYSSYASDQAYHSKPKKHKPSSTWYDSDLAQAAAASQLHPDEFHNLFFGSDSSSSSKGTSRRQARKQAQKRAKQLRKQAQAMGVSGHGFAYAEAGAGEGRWHAAYDSDDDSYNSYSDSEEDDEYLGGTYRYYSPGQGRSHRQARQWEWQREQPDWQWWTAEQEREWFQQAWQNGSSGSQQRQQHTGHHQAWWERFQQQQQRAHHQHQQQQQQQHRQHQWQRWGYSSNSSNSSSGSSSAGAGSHWQQSMPSHTPAILQHLSALDLPPSTQLQRQQLKVAFHKVAMQWHPDKHPEPSAKVAAESKFKEAKAAYEVLVQHAKA